MRQIIPNVFAVRDGVKLRPFKVRGKYTCHDPETGERRAETLGEVKLYVEMGYSVQMKSKDGSINEIVPADQIEASY
ncbi:MAG: hypothetical protein RLZZ561_857 [Pseudomonadota bacterium]|jgi:hypothetical protein